MKNILNLGCGMGANIPLIENRGKIYNVDIDEKALKICQKKFPDCDYSLSSAENLSFLDLFFDEIYCFDVLEHVENLNKTMKNLYKFLKDDGFLYVEIPYSKSEKILQNIKGNYFEQIGHKRVFEYDKIDKIFKEFGFIIQKKRKSRGIVHIKLRLLFKLGFNISNQQGGGKGLQKFIDIFFTSIFIRFDKNIFNSYYKYFPIRIVTLPIGYIISLIFPKTIELYLKKII